MKKKHLNANTNLPTEPEINKLTYYNHFTGEKRTVKRAAVSGKGTRHDGDALGTEQTADTEPLDLNSYKGLKNANEVSGAAMYFCEPGHLQRLYDRGNTIDDIRTMVTDILAAATKHNVQLPARLENLRSVVANEQV